MALSEFMDVLRQAARERRVCELDYYSELKDEETFDRLVEPYEIKGGYFWAYDINDGSIKRFTVEGVTGLRLTEQRFSPRWPIKI